MATRSNVAFVVLFGSAIIAVFLIAAVYLAMGVLTDRTMTIGDAVAVVDLTGEIVYDLAKLEEIGDYRDDGGVKAVLLRVDSPGGGVAASQALYHEILRTREVKPVVVSMGSVAASGGYYVSCAADSIVAHEGTVTGSIGVIAEYLRTEELFQKIGLEVTVLKAGRYKDVGSPYREMTPDERAYLGELLDKVYDQFIRAVSEGRRIPVDRVRELAEGRLYTGEEAVKLGLVDRIGTYDDALRIAARMGGISGEPRVVRRERRRPLLERLLGRYAGAVPLGRQERISLKYIIP
jgi:protease-4